MFKNLKFQIQWPYALLFAFAFSLRLIYLFEQSFHNPLFDFPIVDAKVYSDWADEIVRGTWWWPDLRNYLPTYPWFIAICKLFFWGDSPWGVKIVQALLSSIACVLLAIITKRAFGKRVGLIAGFLFACNWMFILYDGERFSESFSLSMLVFGLYLLSNHFSWKNILLSALFCSVAVASRPNLIPLLLVFAGWIYISQTKETRKTIPSIAFLCVTALIFLPVLYHNHSLSGKWILRAQQNWNFYVAVDPSMDGLSPAAGIEFDKYMLKPVLQGHYTHEDQDEYWGRETMKLIGDKPLLVLKTFLFDRGMVFLNATEWSQELDVAAFRAYSSLLRLPWPGFGWIFPLAFVGLVAVIRSRTVPAPLIPMQRFLMICLVTAFCFTFISKVTGRYRFPIVLFLIPFAAVGFEQLIKSRDRKRVAQIFLLCAAGIFSWIDWMDLSRRQTAMHHFYIGQKYQNLGRLEEAEAAFRSEAIKQPWNANAPNELARILWKQNRIPEARAAVLEAIEREPQFWNSWTLQASLEIEQKEYTKAVASLDHSLAIYPLQPEPWMLKQHVYAELGDWKKEEEAFHNGIKLGANPSFSFTYASRLENRGLFREAMQQYRVIAEDPSLAPAYRARAYMLAGYLVFLEVGREDHARQIWKKVEREYSQTNPFAHEAKFLLGHITAAEYLPNAERFQSAHPLAFYDFNRGVRLLMSHDRAKANEAFRECLARKQLSAKSLKPAGIPEKWAWKFLQEVPEESRK
jgi:tetratricopeptide (TPR) repeat protein